MTDRDLPESDATEPKLTERLEAILVADVVGYSRLMQDDQHATLATLDRCRAVFDEHVGSHGGRVVDMAGDSVLAVFDTAAGATKAAIAAQQEVQARNQALVEDRRMRFRIGIHLGDIIEKDDGSV